MSDLNVQRTLVTSSAIASVGYESRSMILEVEFHRGAVYRYFDVPPKVYEEFLGATSKGTWFNQRIREHFTYAAHAARDSP